MGTGGGLTLAMGLGVRGSGLTGMGLTGLGLMVAPLDGVDVAAGLLGPAAEAVGVDGGVGISDPVGDGDGETPGIPVGRGEPPEAEPVGPVAGALPLQAVSPVSSSTSPTAQPARRPGPPARG